MHRLTVQYDVPTDPDAFNEQYFDEHLPMCRSIPGIVAVSISAPELACRGTAPYLVAELDFPDSEAFKTAMRSPEMAAVAKDAETLPAGRVKFTGKVTAH